MCQSCRLPEVKNKENLKCRHLKKWSRSLTRSGRLREVPTKGFELEKLGGLDRPLDS